MLPVLEGIMARRILLNFRIDPAVVRRRVPAPLEVATQSGFAMAGVCLIRLEKLRPKGCPISLGISAENMAHRIAIRYPAPDGMRDGVFIWRRETDARLVSVLGGRLFPGVHGHATFSVHENPGHFSVQVCTPNGDGDVAFGAIPLARWQGSVAFETLAEASRFYEKGNCGFSLSLDERKLEGMRLRTHDWQVEPLHIYGLHAAFFADTAWFPPGSAEFDHALLMRGIRHEWHELEGISARVLSKQRDTA